MRVLTFTFAGAATTKWIPEKDYVLRGAITSASTLLVSVNPNAVATDLNAATGIREDMLFFAAPTTTRPDIRVKISKGVPLYFVAAGALGALIYLE